MLIRKNCRHACMSEFVICLTTCEPKDAEWLARRLVEQRVCACVNVIPQVSSTYHWKGKIEVETESILLIKSRRDSVERLEAAIKELHPYELPEFIVIEISDGSGDYLSWITASMSSGGTKRD